MTATEIFQAVVAKRMSFGTAPVLIGQNRSTGKTHLTYPNHNYPVCNNGYSRTYLVRVREVTTETETPAEPLCTKCFS